MNEIIEKCLKESTYSILGVPQVDQKKFAELLEKEFEAKHFSAGYIAGKSDGIIETVKECLDIVEDEDDGSTDTLAVRWAMHRIKKRFGVEE